MFIVPDHLCFGRGNEMRYTPTGQEPELLRGDRLPAGVDQEAQLFASMTVPEAELAAGNLHGEGDDFEDAPQGLSEEEQALLNFDRVGGALSGRLDRKPRIYRLSRAPQFPGDRYQGDGRGLFGNYGERHGVTFFKPAGRVSTCNELPRDFGRWSPALLHDINAVACCMRLRGVKRLGDILHMFIYTYEYVNECIYI